MQLLKLFDGKKTVLLKKKAVIRVEIVFFSCYGMPE